MSEILEGGQPAQQDPPGEGAGWLWGPYLATAACAGAGFALRAASGGAALGVAAAVLLAPAILLGLAYRLGRPVFGIDQAGEVAYLAGCSTALAGWMAAAGLGAWPLAVTVTVAVVAGVAGWLVYGPGRRVPSLAGAAGAAAGTLTGAALNPFAHAGLIRWALAWAAGTTLAALPFWLHRRTRRRYEPPIVAVDGHVDRLTAAMTKHVHAEVVPVPGSLNVGEQGRFSLRYRLTNGKTDGTVRQVIPAIESELGLRPGAVMVTGSRARRDEITVSVVPVEPRTTSVIPALPASITEPAPLGLHDNGAAMKIAIYDETGARGAVAGGRKGAGKSRGLWTAMKSWTACDDVLFFFADLSGGATSNPWMPCVFARVTEPDRVTALLDALLVEATARAAILADKGWESWRPSARHPAIVFVLDEAQRAMKTDWQARTALENLMQVDRKSGISCVVLCPNPVVTEGISPTIRENAALRLCFASSGQAVKWVLEGTPAEAVAYAVTEFDKPGQVLGYGPGLAPIPGRTYDTDLAEATAVARAHASRRPAPTGILTAVLRDFGAEPGASPGKAPELWSPADTEAAHAAAEADTAMREYLLALSAGPGVLGRTWPARPEPPDIPAGRLSTEQALQVAAAMLTQPGGTTPAAVQLATRRSRSWAFDVLGRWVRQGVATQPQEGRYVAASGGPQVPA